MGENDACVNTDREIWREREGDYYADAIFVTQDGGIGINCGGFVFVKPVREWFKLAGPVPSLKPMPDRTPPSSGAGVDVQKHIQNWIHETRHNTQFFLTAGEKRQLNDDLRAAADYITRLEAEKAEMAKALEPFAKIGSMIVDGNKNGCEFGLQNVFDDWGFATYGDAVRAHELLAPETTDGEKGK